MLHHSTWLPNTFLHIPAQLTSESHLDWKRVKRHNNFGRDTTRGRGVTISLELGKVLTKSVLRLPQEQRKVRQRHHAHMLRPMKLQPSEKTNERTDKDIDHTPPQMYELRSPTQPGQAATRSKTINTVKTKIPRTKGLSLIHISEPTRPRLI
eukprot:1446638-Amphidinium_carterae.1